MLRNVAWVTLAFLPTVVAAILGSIGDLKDYTAEAGEFSAAYFAAGDFAAGIFAAASTQST